MDSGRLQAFYLETISGRRRGLLAGLTRTLLVVLEPLFALAVRIRNCRWDRRGPQGRLDVPVISVGNLTVGGTGKTPMVEMLARHGERSGACVGILMRGYGAAPGEKLNEEGRWLAQRLPRARVVASPDRLAGGAELVAAGVDWIVLDDGFQHRRLGRDLDLVLIDATRPFGYGHLLPRGLLREPTGSLMRADLVVVTRADQVGAEDLERLLARLAPLAPGKPLVCAEHRPRGWLRAEGAVALEQGPSGEVGLISGLAHPAAFERTVGELGLEVQEHRIFPDHHVYERSSIEDGWDRHGAWVTTTKDWVKLARLKLPNLWALDVEMRLRPSHAAGFWSRLDACSGSRSTSVRGGPATPR